MGQGSRESLRGSPRGHEHALAPYAVALAYLDHDGIDDQERIGSDRPVNPLAHYRIQPFPGARKAGLTTAAIPFHNTITEDEVDYVA